MTECRREIEPDPSPWRFGNRPIVEELGRGSRSEPRRGLSPSKLLDAGHHPPEVSVRPDANVELVMSGGKDLD
jgi:hypothetical protein